MLEYGDGWIPIAGRGPDLAERTAELARLAADAGRRAIPVSIFSLRQVDAPSIERYQAAGASRVILGLPPAGSDEVLPLLKRHAQLARSFEEAVPA